jgi:GT2 family glycosyltransferase
MLHAQCREEGSDELLDDGVRVDWRRLRFSQVQDGAQVDCLSTRGLFIRVHDLLASGGFRSAQLPHYLSDYEFTIRLRRQGVRPMIDPRLQLWTRRHAPAASTGGWRAAWQVLFSRRNPSDPRAWLAFVLLSCPWPWKPLCLLRVGKRTIGRFFRLALGWS